MSTRPPGGYTTASPVVMRARVCRASLSRPGEIDPPKCQCQSHETSERERSKKDPEHRSRTLSLTGFGSGQPARQLSLLQFEQESMLRNGSRKPYRDCGDRTVSALENVEEVEKYDD